MDRLTEMSGQIDRLDTGQGMTHLLRTVKVLHHIPIRDGNRVIFRHQDDAVYAPRATTLYIYVNADDYLDMGSPDVLTVTIEPGDRLNN